MTLKKDIRNLVEERGTQTRTELANHFQFHKKVSLEAAYKALRQAQLVIDDGKCIHPPLTSMGNLLSSRLWDKSLFA